VPLDSCEYIHWGGKLLSDVPPAVDGKSLSSSDSETMELLLADFGH
jgi:hypothetical protein